MNTVAQLKYVEEEDMTSIGMSRPEVRRMRQFIKKETSRGALNRIKKVSAVLGVGCCWGVGCWGVGCCWAFGCCYGRILACCCGSSFQGPVFLKCSRGIAVLFQVSFDSC